jgi:hypothetical protein
MVHEAGGIVLVPVNELTNTSASYTSIQRQIDRLITRSTDPLEALC